MRHYQATRRAAQRATECSWTEKERRVCREQGAVGKLFCPRHQAIWDAMMQSQEA